jgi:uncharacterized protein (DUF2267 family)
MDQQNIAQFDNTVQTANRWINELMEELGWDDRHSAYHALRIVLHSLRDRLTVDEVADLGAQLPMLIRGLYYEGWKPGGKPARVRSKEVFLAPVAAAFHDEPNVFPEAVAWGVFKVLNRHVSAGEIKDVKHILPTQIVSLWPDGEAHLRGGQTTPGSIRPVER